MTFLNLYGPLGDLGYGIYTRGIIKGLLSNGADNFHLSPIGPIQMQDHEEAKALTQQSKSVLWNRSAPSVAIWHEFDLNKFSGNKLLAYPIFETTKLVPAAINYLKQMDVVLTTSKWAKNIVEENIGINTRVEVVRGASETLETPAVTNTKRNPNAFTFLSVGKLEVRKSYLETIQAYAMAFADKDLDTRLICHCYNPFDKNFINTVNSLLASCGFEIVTNTTITGSIIGRKGSAFVEVPKGHMSQQQLFQLYRYSHVGVFASKAEGWNLPLVEAIKSDLPCIATDYSAHTEYLTSEFNYPENLLLRDLNPIKAQDGMFFHGDRGDWSSVNVEELAEKMIWSYNNYEALSKEFDSSKVRSELTWRNSASKLVEVLNSL